MATITISCGKRVDNYFVKKEKSKAPIEIRCTIHTHTRKNGGWKMASINRTNWTIERESNGQSLLSSSSSIWSNWPMTMTTRLIWFDQNTNFHYCCCLLWFLNDNDNDEMKKKRTTTIDDFFVQTFSLATWSITTNGFNLFLYSNETI